MTLLATYDGSPRWLTKLVQQQEAAPPATATAAEEGLAKLALSLADLRRQAAHTHPDPTQAQKDEGNFRKGKVSWKGLPISIEVAKGNYRKGVSKSGKAWANKMKEAYGYFRGTEGKDGDQVDVFVCEDDLDSELVFVVNQIKPDTGSFDEHKTLIGLTSAKRAKEVYLSNYADGWQGLGSLVPMTIGQFKNWLENSDKHKAVTETSGCRQLAKAGSHNREVLDGLGGKKAAAKEVFTVAADLDGTLAKLQETYDPKTIGEPRKNARRAMQAFKEEGARLVIHTVRGDTKLVEAWLKKHDIPYDHVNENPDQPEDSSSKMIASVYWDDRGVDSQDDDSWTEVLRRIKADKKQ